MRGRKGKFQVTGYRHRGILEIVDDLKFVLLAVLIVIFILGYCTAYRMSGDHAQVLVTDKYPKARHNRGALYIVQGQDEAFCCEDSWLFLKWDSTDVYRDLQVGKTYRISVAGWRIPFLSWYRNILAIEKECDNGV